MRFYNDNSDENVDAYFKEISESVPLSREREAELARRIKEGDTDARDELVTANIKFVVSMAKRFRNYGVQFSDLIADGNIGLMKAAEKFDPECGTRFITYAAWWIRDSIQQGIDRYRGSDDANSYEDVDDEVASRSVLDSSEYIDSDMGDRAMSGYDRKKAIDTMMSCLKEREIEMLTEYFGLNGNKKMTLKEIGKKNSISAERVRQIVSRSIEKMRTSTSSRDAVEFYDTF